MKNMRTIAKKMKNKRKVTMIRQNQTSLIKYKKNK